MIKADKVNEYVNSLMANLSFKADYQSFLKKNGEKARLLIVEGTTDETFVKNVISPDVACMIARKAFMKRASFGAETREQAINYKAAIVQLVYGLSKMPQIISCKGSENWIVYGMIDLDFDDEDSNLYKKTSQLFVTDTHVRPAVVVEADVSADDIPGMLDAVETPSGIDCTYLDNPVNALCNSIVRRFVILRHGDGDAVCPEHSHILIATILYTTVGVMDQACKHLAAGHCDSLVYGLAESLHRDGCTQCICEHPANDLAGIGIGDEMQIAHATIVECYIGNVCNPQLVRRRRNEVLDKVLPFVVAVIRIRCVTRLRRWKHQTVTAQDDEETVASRHVFASEKVYQHDPQFIAAYARILFTDRSDILYYLSLTGCLCFNVGLRLVEGLTTMAKQPAYECHLQAALEDQLHCYLAPDFFRIGMSKYSSALSIIMSRARVSRRENSSAFSSSRLRFFNSAISFL